MNNFNELRINENMPLAEIYNCLVKAGGIDCRITLMATFPENENEFCISCDYESYIINFKNNHINNNIAQFLVSEAEEKNAFVSFKRAEKREVK